MIPGDSLVYLETSDLGKVLDAITSNPKFQQLAKTKPDTSALNGIRLSVAVTGFQTSEQPEGEGTAVLDFKPSFVAVAETNAWNYQTLSFAENKLGEFVNDIYEGEVELITTDKHGGTYFTWTAPDGRKAFALVRGSLILFGNDETAIDNCVNVMNGGGESIAKNAKVSAFVQDSLASGYVSKDGVAQIANIAGVSLAVGAGEETEVQSFISRVIPEIVRNSVTEATWIAKRESGMIEDRFTFSLDPSAAKVLDETLAPADATGGELFWYIPKEFVSATIYNLKDPRIAWRSVLLTARTRTDEVSGNLLTSFSPSLFEPYGIEDAELFLSGLEGSILTVRLDADGDEVVAIGRVKDTQVVKAAVAKELESRPQTSQNGTQPGFETVLRSTDGELAAAFHGNTIVIGDGGSVDKCMAAFVLKSDAASGLGLMVGSRAAVATAGSQADPQARLVSALSSRKDENTPLAQNYFTETRFNQNGVERRTVSDFGLIGSIIERLGPGN